MTVDYFSLDHVDSTWHVCLRQALKQLDPHYAAALAHSTEWLPGSKNIFNAFSLPLSKVNYVLFGESPYPRKESANGYAFWDAAVTEIWSPTGLNKKVNRATSLRNIIKMLLTAEGVLPTGQCTQENIARLPKTHFIKTNDELFYQLINHGFLLLNATLVLQKNAAKQDALAWQPFMKTLLTCLLEVKPDITFILLGRIAAAIDQLLPEVKVNKICAEHPYNLSFINNEKILNFFRPLHLLNQRR